ncbi:LytR/AlgR family response regulator transcription factor [Sphingobacterium siyangense]|uniref:LytTR family two component transcriptional regulator n=1 Tax=Sphingobacterium siyangense TaxID=459529 RepID=A0A562LZI4_9SPHI|nr:LytTR family DNA-binding domain-containing protein [Sphingobacterium siyangense]TWI13069.1 LytTR family two component transcriptional regulator [Sphingobacterium siyangense]
MINSIIVDDEPLAREGLQGLLKDNQQINLMGSFNSVSKAKEFLKQNKVDLIFLDIEMPNVSGMEWAYTLDKDILVVFITAYTNYAIDSYEVNAVDYLLKPISLERLNTAIEKAHKYKGILSEGSANTVDKIDRDYMLIRADKRFFKVRFEHILFVEALKDYVIIYTKDNKLIANMNLRTIHSSLSEELFIRVSKSFIVNKDKIDSFDNHTIYIGEHEIPVGEAYKDSFLNTFF